MSSFVTISLVVSGILLCFGLLALFLMPSDKKILRKLKKALAKKPKLDKSIVEKKLIDTFYEIAQKELIYIIVHKNNSSNLNKDFPELVEEGDALKGTYVHLKKEYDSPAQRIFKKLPKIHLPEKLDVITFAHELGHHFSVKENNDETEIAANKYAIYLFKQLLTEEEFELFEIDFLIRDIKV